MINQKINYVRDKLEYHCFINPPAELLPSETDIGQMLEVAGYKPNDCFKLYEIREDHYLTVDSNGKFRAFSKDSAILHRNEKIRNSNVRTVDIYMDKVAKKTQRARKRKRR